MRKVEGAVETLIKKIILILKILIQTNEEGIKYE